MVSQHTVLVVGGTGKTGRRVVRRLLECDMNVRAIVRSAERLPEGIASDPRLEVLEADLLDLSDAELLRQVRGCDAVVSCLGHVINLRGMFGPPRDLVTQAARRLCQAIEASRPSRPVRFVLMSTVSVNQPAGRDTRRGSFEKSVVWVLRGLVPPARDNQQASDYFCREIGTSNPSIEWVVVRPDTLLEDEASPYALHDNLVSSLFRPDSTARENVARFMCDLVTDDGIWDRWRGRLPVIVNVEGSVDRAAS